MKRTKRMKALSVLPCLFTLGNAVCGFGAIAKIATLHYVNGAVVNSQNLTTAAWLILLAMVFDALDGRIARMTNQTSDFGGELDSMSDAITYGVAPALLVAIMNSVWNSPPIWAKSAWVFAVAYVCGAIMRLARFNVENSHDEDSHRSFKGLPSPAAAGCIASLVLVRSFLLTDHGDGLFAFLDGLLIAQIAHAITLALPPIALILGYLMISSRIRYIHVANRYLGGKKTFDYVAFLIFGLILAMLAPELVLATIFFGFALTGPISLLLRTLRPSNQEGELPRASG